MDHMRSLRPRASGLAFGVNVGFSAFFNFFKKKLDYSIAKPYNVVGVWGAQFLPQNKKQIYENSKNYDDNSAQRRIPQYCLSRA